MGVIEAELALINKERPAARPPSKMDLVMSSIFHHPQPDSLFFTRLPPELRRRIYQEIFGDKLIYIFHIRDIPGRLVHQQFPLPAWTSDDDDDKRDNDDDVQSREARVPHTLDGVASPRSHEFHKIPLSFLRTCHASRAEVLTVLYSSNIYAFPSPLPLVYLYDLHLIPRLHFALIRHLRLPWFCTGTTADDPFPPNDFDTWSRFWKVVAEMKLASLEVEFVVWGAESEDIREETDWVQAMMRVKGIRKVKVSIVIEAITGVIKQPALERALRRRWTSDVQEAI